MLGIFGQGQEMSLHALGARQYPHVLVEITKLVRIQIVYIAQKLRIDFEAAVLVSTIDIAAVVWLAIENPSGHHYAAQWE